MISFSSLSKRRGATPAGVFSLALGCALLLCGAGSAPIENLLPQGAMQGDLNAGGHSLTNAATVSATNVVVSGTLTAPSSFTLPFSGLTGTPTSLAGYGITDPIVLTSGSYADPGWITSLAGSKLTGSIAATTVPWSGVSSTPTSLAGYGITDPIVLTSGSYANPGWITSLAGSKLTGSIAATTVPWSGVSSTPTSLAGYGITDPIVLTSGSYANPGWITSLAGSKLTGSIAATTVPWSGVSSTPTTFSGYGLTVPLLPANNLNDLGSPSTARTNLGIGSAGVQAASYFLIAGNNFSDVPNLATARSNLGLGSAATTASSAYDAAGAAAAVTPTTLGLVIGTNTEAWNANLDTLAASSPFTAGTNITITGTWPNLTFAAAGVSWPLVSTDGNLSFGSTAGTAGYIDDSGNGVFASVTAPIVGGTTSSYPAAGNVGYASTTAVALGSAVSLSNNATTNVIAGPTLAAGHYLMSGNVTFKATTATVTQYVAYIDSGVSQVYLSPQLTAATASNTITIESQPIIITSPTTSHLTVKASFSAGTVSAYGTFYIWQAP